MRSFITAAIALSTALLLVPKPQSNSISPSTVVPGASLTVVYASEQFFEGPSWDPVTQKLYFTAFEKGNEQILRLDAPNKALIWMDHTQGMNGTYLSRNGRLLIAQAFGHTLSSLKIGPDGP